MIRKLGVALILVSVISTNAFANDNPLAAFDNLIGRTWTAEGKWGNGSAFKQVATFEYGLNDRIVVVRSQGFTDQAQTKFGDRNHGVRQFDAATETIRFWEFDTFGGVTEGTVRVDGKNLYYEYEYGGTRVTDLWQWVDDNTYNYIVGTLVDGKWGAKFIETTFRAGGK